MPNDINFNIGDTTRNKNIGMGLVLGCRIDPVKCVPIYHIYFTDKKLFRYSYTRNLEFIKPADDTSIDAARNILLATSKTEPQIGLFNFGDIVYTPLGKVILLDNGHVKPNGSEYYHAACLSNNTLHYIDHMDIFYTEEKATDLTRKQAKQILFEYVLSPAFSDE